MQTRVKFEHTGYTWQGRLLFGLLAAAGLVLSLTFAGMFLVVGTLAVLVIGARLAWMRWRLRHLGSSARSRVIDGQYVVVERHPRHGGGRADV